jgi:hypothetical protein
MQTLMLTLMLTPMLTLMQRMLMPLALAQARRTYTTREIYTTP